MDNNNQNRMFGEETVNVDPAPEPPVGEAVKAMVFGILSIELSALGILGIIFGALARKWSLPIIENWPYTNARLFAKAGRITGSVGLGLSIGFTVLWALYGSIIFLAVILAALVG